MKKKTKFKLIAFIIIIVIALIVYFTGTYDYFRIRFINYFENTLNRKGLELIKGTGSLIDNATLSTLEDSGITGSNLSFNSIDNAYYAILEDNEKKLYHQIYANIVKVEESFKPVVKINQDGLSDVIEAVYNDHPELFWVDTTYSYKYLDKGEIAQITLSYNSTINDLDEAKELFTAKANEIINEANTYTSDFYKEKYVHDTLIKNNVYNENEELNQSAYSAIVTNNTVCAGYSRAFQYIMNKLGIRTYYISGDSSGNHSWNIVELENEYYNVDLTWDDQKKISYRYFNVPDSIFTKTHIRKDLSIYLPVCRGNKYYNYETKNASKIIRGEMEEDKPGETIPRSKPKEQPKLTDDYDLGDSFGNEEDIYNYEEEIIE